MRSPSIILIEIIFIKIREKEIITSNQTNIPNREMVLDIDIDTTYHISSINKLFSSFHILLLNCDTKKNSGGKEKN